MCLRKCNLFRDQEIDFQLLLSLTDEDFKQLGVTLLGPRSVLSSPGEPLFSDQSELITNLCSNPSELSTFLPVCGLTDLK